MQVTVYDKVPATAEISVGQVESYLRRTGWVQRNVAAGLAPAYWERVGRMPLVQLPLFASVELLTNEVMVIAASEYRYPSAVLADIAKEGGGFRGVLDGVERLPKSVVKEGM